MQQILSRKLAWRALYLVGVLLAATILTALLIDLLPGNPAIAILGRGATPSAVAQIDAELHLNQPFLVRYGEWLAGLVHGDFGSSYLTGLSVGQTLLQRIPVTFELIVLTQILALLISVPLGIYCAYRQGGVIDKLVTGGVFFFVAMPVFVLGVLLTLAFAVDVQAFPASGFTPFLQDPLQSIYSLLLPAITLASGALAGYVRVLRAEMIATLQEDYISVARSKGLSTRHILIRHALKPSSLTLATIAGLNTAGLIGGAVVVEQLFSVPGVGSYLVSSILQRDYVSVQGAVVVIAVAFVLVNLAVDVVHTVLDPRVAHGTA